MERCFASWVSVCVERSWKRRLQTREREIGQLQSRYRLEMHRRVVLLKRARQKTILRSWINVKDHLKQKKIDLTKATRLNEKTIRKKAVTAWSSKIGFRRILTRSCFRTLYLDLIACRKKLLCKSTQSLNRLKLASGIKFLRKNVVDRQRKRSVIEKADSLSRYWTLRRSIGMWIENNRDHREQRRILNRWMTPLMVSPSRAIHKIHRLSISFLSSSIIKSGNEESDRRGVASAVSQNIDHNQEAQSRGRRCRQSKIKERRSPPPKHRLWEACQTIQTVSGRRAPRRF